MNHTFCKTSILVTGVLFLSSLLSIPLANLEGKEVSPLIDPKKGETVTSPPSKEQKESPTPQGVKPQGSQLTTPVSMPIYIPPRRGAPIGRIGGGTRGGMYEWVTLFALVPDHVGLTSQEQPNLYWYLSKPTDQPIEVTIIEDEAIYPILETGIPALVQPGIHPIDLKEHHVFLSLGKQYRWYVAIIPDPDRRSRDIIAGGMIERIEPSENIRTKLAQSDKETIPYIYAEAGFWYDALAAISDLIDATPDDAGLRKERSALLDQVGLSEIAD